MLIVASIPAEAGSIFKQRFRLFLSQRAAEPAEATGWVPNFRIASGSYFVVENWTACQQYLTCCFFYSNEPSRNKAVNQSRTKISQYAQMCWLNLFHIFWIVLFCDMKKKPYYFWNLESHKFPMMIMDMKPNSF